MNLLMVKNKQELLNNLARNVKAAREDLGYSQLKLAEEAGLSNTHITDIERGRKWVSATSLSSLARALMVEPWTLLEPEHQSVSTADMRFARLLAREVYVAVADTAHETARRFIMEQLGQEAPPEHGQPQLEPPPVSFRDAHRPPDPFADPESRASESPGESDEQEDPPEGS